MSKKYYWKWVCSVCNKTIGHCTRKKEEGEIQTPEEFKPTKQCYPYKEKYESGDMIICKCGGVPITRIKK